MADEAPDTIRKAVHDLNGQIFLIRGHIELARAACPEGPIRTQLDEIFRHTDTLADVGKRLRQFQQAETEV